MKNKLLKISNRIIDFLESKETNITSFCKHYAFRLFICLFFLLFLKPILVEIIISLLISSILIEFFMRQITNRPYNKKEN